MACGFKNTMQGWYDFRSMFLDRFTPPHESVRIHNELTTLVWKPAVTSLNAHILIFATKIHFLDMLNSPLSQPDQITQFSRSLNSRQLTTQVKSDMTLLQAIQAVQRRAPHPVYSRRDFTSRNHGHSSRQLTAVLNELNLDKGEGNDDDLYYDAKEEDEENTRNAIRATSQGIGGDMTNRSNQARLNHESIRSAKRAFNAQQYEWYRNKKCIRCGQDGHFKRDCLDRAPTTHMGG
jgi:hypothetical protein